MCDRRCPPQASRVLDGGRAAETPFGLTMGSAVGIFVACTPTPATEGCRDRQTRHQFHLRMQHGHAAVAVGCAGPARRWPWGRRRIAGGLAWRRTGTLGQPRRRVSLRRTRLSLGRPILRRRLLSSGLLPAVLLPPLLL